MVGVDDDYCRGDRRPRWSNAGKRVVRISVSAQRARRGLFMRDGTQIVCAQRAASRSRSRDSRASARCAARTMRRTRRLALRRRAGARPDARQDPARLAHASPAWRTAWRRSAARARVLFVNDSKATNADCAAKALASFSDIYWIAGGKPKEGGIAPLRQLLPAHPQGLSDRRGGRRTSPRRSTARCPTRSSARSTARSTAAARDAAASAADRAGGAAFAGLRVLRPVPNFEVRGDAFRELVLALPGVSLPEIDH